MYNPPKIRNFANNCFINCALQIFLNLPKSDVYSLCQLGFNDQCKITREMLDLLVAQYNDSSSSSSNHQNILNISKLYQLLIDNKVVKLNQQGDYHEVLLFILDRLQSQGKLNVEQYFTGKFKKTIICQNCEHRSSHREVFSTVTLSNLGIIQSIIDLATVVTIDSYDCEKCKRQGSVQSLTKIEKMPKILMLHSPVKLKDRQSLHHKYDINIDGYNHLYYLYLTVHHTGNYNGGHYYCQLYRNGHYYRINDDNIKVSTTPDTQNIISVFLISGGHHPP